MIDYRAGEWGFHVAFGWHGSLAPRALTMAIPNAVITYCIARWFINTEEFDSDTSKQSQLVIGTGNAVMIFILYNRSRTSYNRWWEGGTLLQKARGEWFNAYSSIMAFTSTKPELQDQVHSYVHFIARLMSLLMCCALQQVSPNRDRPFEIIGLEGIEPASMEFLNSAPDKVEIILQWIQRSMVLHMHTGVLPAAPPILSRAFQEVSRGIVNLQNARKIADFPYPYPLAQVSMILQLLHWAVTPFASSIAFPQPVVACTLSFVSIFVLWCIHFNALDLEFPFGNRVNDLPMHGFQQDWNKSVSTLVQKTAQRPPMFAYDPAIHDELTVQMSDASDLYIPQPSPSKSNRNSMSTIAIKATGKRKDLWVFHGAAYRSPASKKQPAASNNQDLPVSPTSSQASPSPTASTVGGITPDIPKYIPPQKDPPKETDPVVASTSAPRDVPQVPKRRITLTHGIGGVPLVAPTHGVDGFVGDGDSKLLIPCIEVEHVKSDPMVFDHGVGPSRVAEIDRGKPGGRPKDEHAHSNSNNSTSSRERRSGQGAGNNSSIDRTVLNDASTLRGFAPNHQGSPRHQSKGTLVQPKRLEPLVLTAGSNESSSSSGSRKQLQEM